MTFERAASAGIWSTIELVSRQGVSFLVVIFLARLLSPEDFGVFAFAALAIMLSAAVIGGGLSTLIVQRHDLQSADLNRIFSFALILSVIAALSIAGLGPVLAAIYGFDDLSVLMPALALQPVIVAMGLVQSALLHKQLQFKLMAKVGWASSLIGGGAAIYAAYAGWGIWALVIQVMIAALINSALIAKFSDWRPTLTADLRPIFPLLRFAGPVSVAQGLHILYTQGFALIVGKQYSASDVGLFNRGFALTQLPNQLFTGLAGKVALPLFSERADDPEALRRGMQRGLEGVMFFSTPAFVGLAVLAPELVELLYGDQWERAAPVVSILALAGILMPLQSANGNLLLAKGMSKTFFRIELAKKSIGIALVVTASFYGIEAVAWAYLAASMVWLFLNTRHTASLIGFGLLDQLRHISGIILVSGIMGAVVLVYRQWTDLPLIADIASSVALGVTTYMLIGFGLRMSSFRRAFADAKALIAQPT